MPHRALHGRLFMFPPSTPTSAAQSRRRYVHFFQSLLSFLDHKKGLCLKQSSKNKNRSSGSRDSSREHECRHTHTYIHIHISHTYLHVYIHKMGNKNIIRQRPPSPERGGEKLTRDPIGTSHIKVMNVFVFYGTIQQSVLFCV